MKLNAALLALLLLGGGPVHAETPVPPAPIAAARPPAAVDIPVWTVDRPRSSLQFKGFSHGKPFVVTFQSWSAEIAFDPDRPQLSTATITVDTRSGSTGEATYKDYLVAPSWFDPQQIPYAQFHITSFSKMDKDVYQGNGVLHIYNAPKTVMMPFPGLGIPVRTTFKTVKNKPTKGEFVSNFTFAVPDFSESDTATTENSRPRKINLIMTLKTTKGAPEKPQKSAEKPKGK